MGKEEKMIETTILKVSKSKKGHKAWLIVDAPDKFVIGEIVCCGVPYPARLLPVGTTYTSVLDIPYKVRPKSNARLL